MIDKDYSFHVGIGIVAVCLIIMAGFKVYELATDSGDYTEYKIGYAKTKDGIEYIVIHDHYCKHSKHIFESYYKKCDYMKRVYEVYCPICIDEKDAFILNSFSNANITLIEESGRWLENPVVFTKEIDKSDRTFELNKGFDKNGSLVTIHGEVGVSDYDN